MKTELETTFKKIIPVIILSGIISGCAMNAPLNRTGRCERITKKVYAKAEKDYPVRMGIGKLYVNRHIWCEYFQYGQWNVWDESYFHIGKTKHTAKQLGYKLEYYIPGPGTHIRKIKLKGR